MSSGTVRDDKARGRFEFGLAAAGFGRTSLNQATGFSLALRAEGERIFVFLTDFKGLACQGWAPATVQALHAATRGDASPSAWLGMALPEDAARALDTGAPAAPKDGRMATAKMAVLRRLMRKIFASTEVPLIISTKWSKPMNGFVPPNPNMGPPTRPEL